MSAIDPLADIASSADIGAHTRVWALAQVREHASVGQECIIGRAAYIDRGVRIGNRVKIQNLAQLYAPAQVADGVFIGPAVILTNDQYPRAVTPRGDLVETADWNPVGVIVREGASLGARAVCVAPVVIGRWSMVAAGSTVVHDVPDFALVAGTPATVLGWVGRAGRRLAEQPDGTWLCPVTGDRYHMVDGTMVEDLT